MAAAPRCGLVHQWGGGEGGGLHKRLHFEKEILCCHAWHFLFHIGAASTPLSASEKYTRVALSPRKNIYHHQFVIPSGVKAALTISHGVDYMAATASAKVALMPFLFPCRASALIHVYCVRHSARLSGRVTAHTARDDGDDDPTASGGNLFRGSDSSPYCFGRVMVLMFLLDGGQSICCTSKLNKIQKKS